MRRLSVIALLAAVAALGASLAAAPSADAQKDKREPKRPPLDASADTNDWQAYYQYGIKMVQSRPDKAVEAFYWASRLNPSRAEPLFGLWASTWMTKPDLLWEYWQGAEYVINGGEAQRIDSLRYRAILRNPFVHRALQRVMIARAFDTKYGAGNWEWNGEPEMIAEEAYFSGRFSEAAQRYGQILAKSPNAIGYHSDRADAFHGMHAYDSAAAEVSTLVQEMQKRDRKRLVSFYTSKAIFLYELGILKQLQGDFNGAREAYGQALSEDLAFYMAHGALGGAALQQGDTATALAEYGQAVDLNGTDPVLRHDYGFILLASGKNEEAAAQLKAAVDLDPWFATAHYFRAVALDRMGKKLEAIESYTAFLQRAPRSSTTFANAAKARLNALNSTGGEE